MRLDEILIQQTPDGILLLDANNCVRFASPAAETLPGISELHGKPFAYPVEDGTEINIENYTVEMRVVNIEWENQPMVLISLRDVTERQQREQKLRQTVEELAIRNRDLDAYTHTIAHGLKNPLASIMGFNSLIKQQFVDKVPSDMLMYLQRIEESVRDMTAMIDNLLYLAKLRDTAQAVEAVDMNIVVKKALRRFERQLRQHNIQVTIAPDLPPALGNEPWLEEVFGNFISNALKYMGKNNPDPRITIDGKIKNGTVRYSIQDNGTGIAKENQADLFEKFTRYHQTEEGTGLGLSIVRRMITKLGGEVGVESEPGRGSTFWFTLPLADENSN